jgi:Flp pilus assembly pilin Flp
VSAQVKGAENEMIEVVKSLKLHLLSRTGDERGVTMVEYAIMLALVGLTVAMFGPEISGAIEAIFTDTQRAL